MYQQFTDEKGHVSITLCAPIHFFTHKGWFVVPSKFRLDDEIDRFIKHGYVTEFILHRFFYRTQRVKKDFADKLIYDLMNNKGLKVRSKLFYAKSKIFGWIEWKKNKILLTK